MFGWAFFLICVRSSVRTMHPNGAYVQMSGRNRTDAHHARVEPPATRNVTDPVDGREDVQVRHVDVLRVPVDQHQAVQQKGDGGQFDFVRHAGVLRAQRSA